MVSQIRGSRQIRTRGEKRVQAGRTKTFRRLTGKGRGGKTTKRIKKGPFILSKVKTKQGGFVRTKIPRKVTTESRIVKATRQRGQRRKAGQAPTQQVRLRTVQSSTRPLPPIRTMGGLAGENLIAFRPQTKLIPAVAPSKRGQPRLFVERQDGKLLAVSRKTAFRLADRGFLSQQSQQQVDNLRPNPVFGNISQEVIGPPPRGEAKLSSGRFLGNFFTDFF